MLFSSQNKQLIKINGFVLLFSSFLPISIHSLSIWIDISGRYYLHQKRRINRKKTGSNDAMKQKTARIDYIAIQVLWYNIELFWQAQTIIR